MCYRPTRRPLREGGGGGLQEGALECLRYLLDPEGMTVNVERAEFLDAFYNKHMGALVQVLSEVPKRCAVLLWTPIMDCLGEWLGVSVGCKCIM